MSILTGELILENLRDVLSLVLHCVVVSHLPLSGHVLDVLLFLVLDDGSLVRNVLDSRFTFDGCLLHLNLGNRLNLRNSLHLSILNLNWSNGLGHGCDVGDLHWHLHWHRLRGIGYLLGSVRELLRGVLHGTWRN